MSPPSGRHRPKPHHDSARRCEVVTQVMEDPHALEAIAPVGQGSVIGGYELVAVLGTGGCGTVYEARHGVLGSRVAVKVLHEHVAESKEMVERFLLEAQAVNWIRHPNIVDIRDVGGFRTGQPYLVMELLDGVHLGSLLERGALGPTEALDILDPVCAAVEAAHRSGIVHLDLKASNIQISDSAGVRRITLLDFGIAKLLEREPSASGLTAMSRKVGTPSSMSPEQIRGGPVDHRADIYALGVLLFSMLTRRYPFESARSLDVERMHLDEPPPRPSDLVAVGADLDAVVLRCLAKDPADRFQSVPDFLAALRAAATRAKRAASSVREPREVHTGAIVLEIQS
ncbi:MAG TPA: serine/threonine-protein kinase [Kofleriaceae bacterium]|nr:serine/threonine-protein kinase [Kofleriaceae bacterium]